MFIKTFLSKGLIRSPKVEEKVDIGDLRVVSGTRLSDGRYAIILEKRGDYEK